MKSKSKIGLVLLLILLLLAGAAFVLPLCIDLNQFRAVVQKKASSALKADVSLESLDFKWLPLPHVLLFYVKAVNQDIDLEAPYMSVYPNWRQLFAGKFTFSRIVLHDPDLFIKGTGFLKKGREGHKAPSLGTIVIHHGGLRISGSKVCGRFLCEKKDLVLNEIEGSLDLNDNRVEWEIRFAPSFAAELSSAGSFSLDSRAYAAEINLSKWRPHTLFLKSWKKYGIRPVDSMVNLHAKIRGTLQGAFSASLTGDMPCFTTHPKEKEIIFSCGYFKTDIHKKDDSLWAHIDQLYLEDPPITLSGRVEVDLPGENDSRPRLKIELTGSDADIAAVRSKALGLFGRHKDVREVFDIVRGGKAIYAKGFFEGTPDQLSKIENYRLEAMVKEADVKIPKVDLRLKKCQGDIRIDKAILTGTDLKGTLGGSSFHNGLLELGLKGRDKMLKAEFDADALVPDIIPILKKVIKDRDFQKEFALFQGLKGRALGRVKLGNSVKHIRPWVDVRQINCSGRYARFSWPFQIKKGRAVVTANSVSWKGVAGTAGLHRISGTSGKVTWGKGKDIFLNISHFRGSLDSSSLLSELNGYEKVRKELKQIVTNSSGRLLIKNASLRGPAKRPREWRYSVTGRAKDLSFVSPMLPAKVFTKGYSFNATQKRIKGGPGPVRLAAGDFNLEIDYRHADFKPKALELELNGRPDSVLLSWVKEKGWIPEPYFPRLPQRLDRLHVQWKKKERYVLVETKALYGEPQGNISVDLALSHEPDFLSIKALHIESSKDNAHLQLTNRGTLVKAVWSGALNGSTVDGILENNILLKGGLAGTLEVECDYSADSPEFNFNGSIELHDFSWIWGVDPVLKIVEGRMHGSGRRVNVSDVRIGVGKGEALAAGSFELKGKRVVMDIKAESDHLSFKDIDLFLSSFSAQKKDKKESLLQLTGSVRFHLGQFDWEYKGGDNQGEKPHVYKFKEVAGAAEVLEKEHVDVEVEKAWLCGIKLSGKCINRAGRQKFNFTFYLPQEKNRHFDELLACLGFEQDLIEGKVALSGWINGSPDNWTGGEINLVSSDGTLRKLTLLAKLFSLLNVTDLFSSRGLPDLFTEGLKYSEMGMHGIVRENKIVFDNIYVKGQGLNMFASGEMNMATMDLNGVILVSPFKTIDAIVSKVPLVSMIIPGEGGAVFSVPVKVTGHFKDPKLDIMPARAVTGTIKNILMNTIKFPWKILNFSGNNADRKAKKGAAVKPSRPAVPVPKGEDNEDHELGIDID